MADRLASAFDLTPVPHCHAIPLPHTASRPAPRPGPHEMWRIRLVILDDGGRVLVGRLSVRTVRHSRPDGDPPATRQPDEVQADELYRGAGADDQARFRKYGHEPVDTAQRRDSDLQRRGALSRGGEAGTRAGSTNDYVPQEGPLREQVLAYTPMSQPGETVEVTFTAPEETGEHGYVCNFPGHWATMQGTMHVKKASA